MENKTALVIMAAGMGSRFGGVKQIEPLGPNGEIIIDYSVYDAVKAGFSKAVFVINKNIEHDFREAVGKRIEKRIDVDYTFQKLDDIPDGFSVPEGRVKPWGTGQAILTAKNVVDTPFVVINSDDYYGKEAYTLMHKHLIKHDNTFCMTAFMLKNTLTENGTVARGVCEIEDGYLKSVTEYTELDKNSGIPLDSPVSMNMWGLTPDIFGELETRFADFLGKLENPVKDEFYIPKVIDALIKEGKKKVRVYTTNDKWYGVTYKADSESVKAAVRGMTESGLYDGI